MVMSHTTSVWYVFKLLEVVSYLVEFALPLLISFSALLLKYKINAEIIDV